VAIPRIANTADRLHVYDAVNVNKITGSTNDTPKRRRHGKTTTDTGSAR